MIGRNAGLAGERSGNVRGAGGGGRAFETEALGALDLDHLPGVDGDLDDAVAEAGDVASDGLDPIGGGRGPGGRFMGAGRFHDAQNEDTFRFNLYYVN
jgi:hypothetical protein